VKKITEGDDFCVKVKSNLMYFLPRDTEDQDKILRELATESRLVYHSLGYCQTVLYVVTSESCIHQITSL